MLTQGEDVEVHALAMRGWSISAIARHSREARKRKPRELASATATATLGAFPRFPSRRPHGGTARQVGVKPTRMSGSGGRELDAY